MLKIITQPKVIVVAVTQRETELGPPGSAWQTNDKRPLTSCEALPEIGGRVCYQSFGGGRTNNAEYLANIIEKGHESVLEHAVVSLGFEGISRSLSHELVRHRHLSPSQLSQRYCRDIAFVVPPDLPAEKIEEWKSYCSFAQTGYLSLLGSSEDKKTANAVARSLLPNCAETKMLVTGNLRAWRHFIKLRAARQAEAEIRRLAGVVYSTLMRIAPNAFPDMEQENDGTVRIVSPKRVDS